MPATNASRLEPAKEKKTTREDKRREMKAPKKTSQAGRPGSAVKKRDH